MPKANSPAADGAQEDDIVLSQEDRADQTFLNREDEAGSDDDQSSQDTEAHQSDDTSQDDAAKPEVRTDPRLDFVNRISQRRIDREKAGIARDDYTSAEALAAENDEDQGDDLGGEGANSDNTDAEDERDDQGEGAEETRRKIKLKVNKREIELDEADVIAAAQKQFANEQRGDRDNAVLDQLVHKLDVLSKGQQTETQNSTTEPEATATTPADGEQITDDIRELVEKIQTGDADEGAQALFELMRSNNQNAPSTEDIESTVTHVLAEAERKNSVRTLLDNFSRENPEIAENQSAMDLVAINMMRTMADEFVKMGVNQDELRPFQNSPAEMYRLHSHYVGMGHGDKLTPIPELLHRTGQAVKPMFAKATDTQQSQETSQKSFEGERTRRKRALSSQPSNSGHSRASTRKPAQPSKKSNRSVIQQMARQRNAG